MNKLSPIRQKVCEIVQSSSVALTTADIATLVDRSKCTVNGHLRALLDLGLVHRRREPRRYANNRYVYFWGALEGTASSDSRRPIASSDPIEQAINCARPHWRKGETFTREQVAEFRRAHEARRKRWFGR